MQPWLVSENRDAHRAGHASETALMEIIVAIEDTLQSEFLSKMSR